MTTLNRIAAPRALFRNQPAPARAVLLASFLLLVACGSPPEPVPPAATAAPTPSASPPAASASAKAPPPARPELKFVQLEPPAQPAPLSLEIKFPIAGQRLRVGKALDYKLRVKLEGTKPGEQVEVEITLDRFRPRRFKNADPIALRDLVDEDASLSEGSHWAFAALVDKSGHSYKQPEGASRAPFAAVHFFVGERGEPEPSPPAPIVVYSQPRGTYNGEAAADGVFCDFTLLGGKLGAAGVSAELSVVGEGIEARHRIQRQGPVGVSGLPSGDFEVTVALLDADGKPLPGALAHAARTITVNRDAPVPEGKR